jgi:hypothetical protein
MATGCILKTLAWMVNKCRKLKGRGVLGLWSLDARIILKLVLIRE